MKSYTDLANVKHIPCSNVIVWRGNKRLETDLDVISSLRVNFHLEVRNCALPDEYLNTVVQSQKAVSAHITSKKIPPSKHGKHKTFV